MKKKILALLEQFAKVMVQPLMYLSVAGLIMVVGVLLTNQQLVEALPFLNFFPIKLFGTLIYDCIMAVINNLSVIFVVGIAAAIAKKQKNHAGLIGLMSYIMYLTASNTTLKLTGNLADTGGMLGLIGTGQSTILGIQNLDMSVFGGIILGCLCGYVFNKTCDVKFKGAFQIYSGFKFSFACMIFVSMGFGVASTYLWPFAQQGISALVMVIKDSGNFGLFLYGFLERLLIPTGLHHLIYTPFQFTDIGGVLQVGDTVIAGAYPIVMAEMQMPIEQFSSSIYYMATGFTKMFGYIGIGAAFIYTAHKQNKAKTRAIIIPLVVTACLAGITEPLDFMFAFVAPVLYVIHAMIAGIFIALLSIFEVTAFCGGNIVSSTIMNVLAGVEKTSYPTMYLLGAIQIVLYFVIFTFVIKKFNLKTPGREDEVIDNEDETIALETNEIKKVSQKDTGVNVKAILDGLGGIDNINTIENCFTRLRVNIKQIDLLDETMINKTKNSGIIKKDNDIQIIYGLEVADIRTALEAYIQEIGGNK